MRSCFSFFASPPCTFATSVYEPFGLAPLEAALCGCAVVARDLPSLREVWGNAALYFNSATALERVLASLAAHPRRLKGAQCRAGQRAARYSTQAMTAQYLAIYEALTGAAQPFGGATFQPCLSLGSPTLRTRCVRIGTTATPTFCGGCCVRFEPWGIT